MNFTFNNLLERLNKNYKVYADNEWVVYKDEETEQEFLLVVRETDNLKESIKVLENEILNDQEEAELSVKQYGIIFSHDEVIFLRIKPDIIDINIQKLLKDLSKISPAFSKKLNNLLKDLGNYNFWDKLFDRTDIIEEFYILYSKAKEKLIKNISGISDDLKREEFVENFLLQLLIIWYIQEKKFLNDDSNYLIHRFEDYPALGFKDYYSLLKKLFKILMSETTKGIFNDQSNLGKIVVTGPAPFINGENDEYDIEIADNIFYIKGQTDHLKKTNAENVSDSSILNVFESRDWTEGNIDEYVLGAIYEKLITQDKRKKTGSYYTPKDITNFICENTLKSYIIDLYNSNFSDDLNSIDDIFKKEDKDVYLFLFKLLNEIRILDPAVGSGHFLEDIVNNLTNLYIKIWKNIQKFEPISGLEIIYINELGHLEEKNLIEFKDEDFLKIYLKFFIVLSRNIYGVDINKTAINVARARLFLNIAKHFNLKKGHFIRFPNIHFNLRAGNSLIGYIHAERDFKNTHISLDNFIKKEDLIKSEEQISIMSKLKEYLLKISKELKIDGDIIEEIQNLNGFISLKKRDWKDFNTILKTKEKLIKILIVSLNTDYALAINGLLNQITKLFNNALKEKFSNDYNLKLNELLKVRTFFWDFEFPDVFKNNHGYDIIIGNPPYGNITSSIEKSIIEKEAKLNTFKTDKGGLRGSKNAASMFIERSNYLLKNDGYLGMILPKSMLYIKEWEKLRGFLLNDVDLKKVVDNSRAFHGVKLEMCTVIYKKSKNINNYATVQNLYIGNLKSYSTKPNRINKKFFSPKRFITEVDANKIEIYEKILEKTQKLGTITDIFRGLNLNKFVKNEPFENSTIIIRGKDIQRYNIRSFGYINKNRLIEFKESSIIAQRIVAHIENPVPHIKIFATFNLPEIPNVNTITNFKIKDNNYNVKFLLILLNSDLINWYMYKCVYINAIRSMDFVGYYASEVPIKQIPKEEQKIFEILANYLLFLNYIIKNDCNSELKPLKNFFNQLANYITYQIYFSDILGKGIFSFVKKYLEDINFHEWSTYFWRDLKEGDLSKKREYAQIESSNKKIIEKVFKTALNDKGLINQLEETNKNSFIKTIRGTSKD